MLMMQRISLRAIWLKTTPQSEVKEGKHIKVLRHFYKHFENIEKRLEDRIQDPRTRKPRVKDKKYTFKHKGNRVSGNLVVKSKLPPRSGSSLEAVEPHPYKGAIK